MKRTVLLFILCAYISAAGQNKIDSLISIVEKTSGEEKVDNLVLLGDEYLEDNPDEALPVLTQAEKLAGSIDYASGLMKAAYYLGDYYYENQMYDTALSYYNRSLRLSANEKEPDFVIKSLVSLSASYIMLGDNSSSKERLLQASALLDSLGRENLNVTNNLGLIYADEGNYSEALKYYQAALKTAEKESNAYAIAMIEGNIANIYFYTSMYEKALEILFKCEKLSMVNESVDKNRIYANISSVYLETGDIDKALKYMNKAIANNSTFYEVSVMRNNLANHYLKNSEYKKAVDEFKKGLASAEEISNTDNMSISYFGISDVYLELYDSLDSGNKDFVKRRLSELNLNQTASLLDSAYYYLDIAIKLSEEAGFVRNLTYMYRDLGRILKYQNKTDEAFRYYYLALEDAILINDKISKADIYYYLSDLWESRGRVDSALFYFKKYSAMRDSVLSEDRSKEIGRLEATHEIRVAGMIEEQKREEEAKIQQAAIMRRNDLQYKGSMLFIILAFGLVLLSTRYKIPVRLAEGIVFVSFLLVFEFILVLLDPQIENFTDSAPAWKLGINTLLAMTIFPIHQFFENKMKYKLRGKGKSPKEKTVEPEPGQTENKVSRNRP